jgi:hypothetical protein
MALMMPSQEHGSPLNSWQRMNSIAPMTLLH